MKFNSKYSTLLQEAKALGITSNTNSKGFTTLSIGKYTMFKDLPATRYAYADAINTKKVISTPTRVNLYNIAEIQQKHNVSVTYSNVYKIDKSGKGRLSTFITGMMGSEPFIYARVEPVSSTSSRTMIYFNNKSIKHSEYIDNVSGAERLPDGTWRIATRNEIIFAKDASGGTKHKEDGPAVINSHGSSEWWINGVRHRLDGPAVEDLKRFEGDKDYREWWVNGKQHRLDGPAVTLGDKQEEWWVNGKLHRLDGPAVNDGYSLEEWWVNDKRHRLDGPAVINSYGSSEWWVNNERHRLDGPAIENKHGYHQWWIHNKQYSEKEYSNAVKIVTAKSRTDIADVLSKYI